MLPNHQQLPPKTTIIQKVVTGYLDDKKTTFIRHESEVSRTVENSAFGNFVYFQTSCQRIINLIKQFFCCIPGFHRKLHITKAEKKELQQIAELMDIALAELNTNLYPFKDNRVAFKNKLKEFIDLNNEGSYREIYANPEAGYRILIKNNGKILLQGMESENNYEGIAKIIGEIDTPVKFYEYLEFIQNLNAQLNSSFPISNTIDNTIKEKNEVIKDIKATLEKNKVQSKEIEKFKVLTKTQISYLLKLINQLTRPEYKEAYLKMLQSKSKALTMLLNDFFKQKMAFASAVKKIKASAPLDYNFPNKVRDLKNLARVLDNGYDALVNLLQDLDQLIERLEKFLDIQTESEVDNAYFDSPEYDTDSSTDEDDIPLASDQDTAAEEPESNLVNQETKSHVVLQSDEAIAEQFEPKQPQAVITEFTAKTKTVPIIPFPNQKRIEQLKVERQIDCLPRKNSYLYFYGEENRLQREEAQKKIFNLIIAPKIDEFRKRYAEIQKDQNTKDLYLSAIDVLNSFSDIEKLLIDLDKIAPKEINQQSSFVNWLSQKASESIFIASKIFEIKNLWKIDQALTAESNINPMDKAYLAFNLIQILYCLFHARSPFNMRFLVDISHRYAYENIIGSDNFKRIMNNESDLDKKHNSLIAGILYCYIEIYLMPQDQYLDPNLFHKMIQTTDGLFVRLTRLVSRQKQVNRLKAAKEPKEKREQFLTQKIANDIIIDFRYNKPLQFTTLSYAQFDQALEYKYKRKDHLIPDTVPADACELCIPILKFSREGEINFRIAPY